MLIAENLLLLVFMLLFSAACWGFGSALFKDNLHSMRILIGMTAILLIIGVLNLIGIAYLAIMSLPLAYGLYQAFKLASQMIKERSTATLLVPKGYVVIGAILALIWVLCAATVAFPDAYNSYDDFQKYFVQPVKMIETGSFYGSVLSTVGKETFGAQAALQSLFIGFLGLSAINAFDAVFCLLLAAFLLLEFSLEKRQLLLGAIVTCLLVTIHPQYVNISSVYSFVCFAIGVVILHYRLLNAEPAKLEYRIALVFGALYASTIALKTSNGFFAIAHFPIVALSLLFIGHEIKAVAKWSAVATFAGILAILPWAVVTFYLAAGASGADGMSLPLTPDLGKLVQLFSDERTFYGGVPLNYSMLLIAGLGLVSMRLAFWNKSIQADVWTSGAALVSAVLVLVYAVAFIGKEQHQFIQTLRYSVPILIGLAPISLLILTMALAEGIESQEKKGFFGATGLLISTFLVVLWIPTKFEFIKQSVTCGSTLSFTNFACSQKYQDYNDYVLSRAAEEHVKKLQTLIPEGATVISWLNYSHLLDYNRNVIIEVDTAGLRNPWAVMPDADYFMIDVNSYVTYSKEQLEHLRQRSMSYERDIKQATLDFIDYLEKDVIVEAVLANDQNIIVYKIRVPEEKRFKPDNDT